MTAYNPPEFQFSGLIFNPLIYEQGVGSTSTNTFTQLTTGLLNTDNIQGIAPADNISLYTLTSGILQLGSAILNTINLYTAQLQMYSPIYFFYGNNTNQLWSTRFYTATNAISTIFYADSTVAGGVPAVSLQSKPLVVGSTTPYNGWYAMVTGKISMICSTQIDLEAPLHNFYNVAKTMYKKMLYGAGGNIYETYYADTISTAETATTTISPFVAGNIIQNNGNFAITCGAFQAISSRFTQLEAPIHNLYNVAKTMYKTMTFGATSITETYYSDPVAPTTATANVVIAKGLSGALNGDVTLNNGRLYANSVSTIELTSPSNLLTGASSTISESSSSYLRHNFGFATNNVYERIHADSTRLLPYTGRIDWTPSPTTPTVINTGVYKLSAGDFQTTAPISPLYSYDATYGSLSTAGYASIGQMGQITQIASVVLTASSTFSRLCRFDSVPVGIYLVYFDVELTCSVANSSITKIGIYIGSGQSLILPRNFDDFVSNIVCGDLTLSVGRTTGYSLCFPLINTSVTNINYSFGITFTGGTITATTVTQKSARLMRLA